MKEAKTWIIYHAHVAYLFGNRIFIFYQNMESAPPQIQIHKYNMFCEHIFAGTGGGGNEVTPVRKSAPSPLGDSPHPSVTTLLPITHPTLSLHYPHP